jgi:hypothetical protein
MVGQVASGEHGLMQGAEMIRRLDCNPDPVRNAAPVTNPLAPYHRVQIRKNMLFLF